MRFPYLLVITCWGAVALLLVQVPGERCRLRVGRSLDFSSSPLSSLKSIVDDMSRPQSASLPKRISDTTPTISTPRSSSTCRSSGKPSVAVPLPRKLKNPELNSSAWLLAKMEALKNETFSEPKALQVRNLRSSSGEKWNSVCQLIHGYWFAFYSCKDYTPGCVRFDIGGLVLHQERWVCSVKRADCERAWDSAWQRGWSRSEEVSSVGTVPQSRTTAKYTSWEVLQSLQYKHPSCRSEVNITQCKILLDFSSWTLMS